MFLTELSRLVTDYYFVLHLILMMLQVQVTIPSIVLATDAIKFRF